MNNIIYTNENDCQDCYKCIRSCPVKAITMIDHHASINNDKCIVCGKCVQVCPVGAQQYRNDETKVMELLASGKKVYLSLAPSFASELDMPVEDLLKELKALGFEGVSETALGAQLVSYNIRKQLAEKHPDDVMFSTACPTVVLYIQKYHPELVKNLSNLYSPLLAHCKLLKKSYGEDIAIVFAGPCIAKKVEADMHTELLDVAITFEELKNIMNKNRRQIRRKLQEIEHKPVDFVPCRSSAGAIYPIDGGMVETITEFNTKITDTKFFNYSGLENVVKIIRDEDFNGKNIFCEFLACEGGCINGSGIKEHGHIISRKTKIIEYFKTLPRYSLDEFAQKYSVEITTNYSGITPVPTRIYSEEELKSVLRKIGKYTEKDYLNCGACGYDTCMNFARACLEKQAEPSMCVSAMRKLAADKLKAFIKYIPMGVAIVDEEKKIVECNDAFLRLSVGTEIEVNDDLILRVIGKKVDKYFDISEYIDRVIDSKERLSRILEHNKKILAVDMFIIGQRQLVGVIIQDITEPTMNKKVIIEKARKVIKNNLAAIQQIAYLLGETAAETETTLNEIIKAFNTKVEE